MFLYKQLHKENSVVVSGFLHLCGSYLLLPDVLMYSGSLLEDYVAMSLNIYLHILPLYSLC